MRIASNAVTADEIAADAVGASEIAMNAVGSSEIASNAVTADEIAADAVGASEIASNAVGSDEIATGAVTADEIAVGAVGSSEILDLSINTIDLADGSVTKSKLSSASVDLDKLDPNVCSAGQLIENNGGSWRCTSISSLTKRRTENILEWVGNGRVKIRERFGEIMTVKIGSNFYDSPSAALTFNFSNGVGLLGLDNGGERIASTWYYLYAVPNGSTFSIVASTRSPIAGTPGPT